MFSPLILSLLAGSVSQDGRLHDGKSFGTGSERDEALSGSTASMQPLNGGRCQVNRVLRKKRDNIVISGGDLHDQMSL